MPFPVRPALSILLVAASALTAQNRLAAYVQEADDSFAYEAHEAVDLGGCTAFNVALTSQTWRGSPWTHWMTIVEPAEIAHPDSAVLVISGGRNGRGAPKLAGQGALYLIGVANLMKCPVVVLHQVPNQPLFDGRREDALIAHTFDQFLRTGEPDWPLLLPMTKAAVRAMDATVSIVAERSGRTIERFCVTGGSKRGWTTWLAGAVDRRVVAIAPMVIDTLNMAEQMSHQLLAWGAFSESIEDYTRLDLQRRMVEDERSHDLLEAVDPWSHRARLTMPKLILIGTNDPYWPIDAARFYIDGLEGESFLHYVPNAGHGLDPSVAGTVTAFFRTVLGDRPRPRVGWRCRETGAGAVVTARSEDPPRAVRLWTAASGTRDFRQAEWSSIAVEAGADGTCVVEIARPLEEDRFVAFYVEMVFEGLGGGSFSVASRAEVMAGGVR